MSQYDSSSIKILEGLEPVRKRPGMYIGSTDTDGLHHLVWEIVDNSIDEALAGYASTIKIKIKSDNSIVVEDNGRGIPIDKHKSGKTGVELVFTELHAGGKFGGSNSAYKTSGGLHGVGSSVVNALSDKLIATIYKNGNEYETIFEGGGAITQNTKIIGPSTKTGTKIQFWPSYKIFKNSKLSFTRISSRLRESAFLISNLEIKIKSEIEKKKKYFKYTDGLVGFVSFINENSKEISKTKMLSGKSNNIFVDIAFQYTDSYQETILSFVNNVKTKDGGTHEIGFKSAWTRIINEYAKNNKIIKSTKNINLDGEDIREGLTAVISLKIPEDILEFVGQTKDKLGTAIAKTAVEKILNEKLSFWLIENKKTSEKIIQKAVDSSKARIAARKAKLEARKLKKTTSSKLMISGKLTPAQTNKVEKKELFLVEGDSAGGSAKLGRDRFFQAILPLRGKVINSERAKLIDILKNEEIATIINTIGAGIGHEFSLKDVNYGKVIIMTDADTDGAHIQALLLTFFFRFMRPLIESGKIFIAQPPLFKVNCKSGEFYAWDEKELKEKLQTLNEKFDIQRYKGLGEMNYNQLWETTMDPETRTLIKVSIPDVVNAERRVSTLMGDNAASRKEWINKNVVFTLEDDFII